jgi:hypothetical protein
VLVSVHTGSLPSRISTLTYHPFSIFVLCVAAPTALQTHGVGIGKSLTSYPTFREQLQQQYAYREDSVVVDGR